MLVTHNNNITKSFLFVVSMSKSLVCSSVEHIIETTISRVTMLNDGNENRNTIGLTWFSLESKASVDGMIRRRLVSLSRYLSQWPGFDRLVEAAIIIDEINRYSCYDGI
jgi:hypothetical protein